ncbi:MAG: hypothetical protein M3Z02_09340 [Actinomycetota bacterium]|nr:hypothetical protein [Actinomycetota bacterium]
MRRPAAALALVVLAALEIAVARAYIGRGTSWHLLLHSSIGAGMGLAVGALVSAARSRPVPGLGWAVLGQLVSILPDVAFLYLRLPHQGWMDVFVGHISIHTAPQPLLVGMGVFFLGGWAWWLASGVGRRAGGLVLTLAAVGLLSAALVAHRPVPTRLSDYQRQMAAQGIPMSSWWCR